MDPHIDPPIDRRIRSLSLDLPDEVQLFCVNLSAPPAPDRLLSSLSREEQARAAAITRSNAVPRYVLTRHALRLILGRALHCDPADVDLVTGEHGRPSLRLNAEGPDFNLSHSADCALIGLTTAPGAIGVDVEHSAKERNVERLARQVLTESELSAMPAAGERAAQDWFYAHWTLKEAYLKALGTGLQLNPKQIAIDLIDDCTPRFVAHPGPPPSLVRSFSPLPGYKAALTVLPP